MPEPEPQPPQPHPVSAARWLLMLVPSVLATAAPLFPTAIQHLFGKNSDLLITTMLILNLAVSVMLCFFLGFQLEKWRWGKAKAFERGIGFGVLILIANGFIAYAGCSVITRP